LPLDATIASKICGGVLRAVGDVVLGALDQERMVAALAQLHDDVEQRRRVGRLGALLEEREVALENRAVVLLLLARQLDENDRLLLATDVLVDVVLHAAQHQRAQHFVQRGDLVRVAQVAERRQKLALAREALAVEQTEQRPELGGVVLQRRAGEQQQVVVREAAHRLERLAGVVLEAMRLVDRAVLPRKLRQAALVGEQHLVGGDQHLELGRAAAPAGRARRRTTSRSGGSCRATAPCRGRRRRSCRSSPRTRASSAAASRAAQ
jgi:hypothetical protein